MLQLTALSLSSWHYSCIDSHCTNDVTAYRAVTVQLALQLNWLSQYNFAISCVYIRSSSYNWIDINTSRSTSRNFSVFIYSYFLFHSYLFSLIGKEIESGISHFSMLIQTARIFLHYLCIVQSSGSKCSVINEMEAGEWPISDQSVSYQIFRKQGHSYRLWTLYTKSVPLFV